MSKQETSVIIIAGEASGDMHGSELICEIQKQQPQWQWMGIGGDRMKAQGVELYFHVREMSFLGFFEVIKHLPFIRRVYKKMSSLLDERRTDLVILVDYPGFNIRFAREAKKRNIPVLYYISPQVWAWKEKRVKTLARLVDRMLVIFPFEFDIYKKEGMDVHFVGHPLKDVVRTSQTKNEFFEGIGLDPVKPALSLLPGSRKQEVQQLLPEMIRAFEMLKHEIPHLQAMIGASPTLSRKLYENLIPMTSDIPIIENKTYDVMAHGDSALVASGTATLETAILGTPMVILYKLSGISYLIGKALVKLKNFGLVNIVAGRQIVPELLQKGVNGDTIAQTVYPFFKDIEVIQQVKKSLEEVSQKLGEPGASRRAAEAVLSFLDKKV